MRSVRKGRARGLGEGRRWPGNPSWAAVAIVVRRGGRLSRRRMPACMRRRTRSPAWAEQLKGQTIVEDAKEGHVERTAMMERQHQRIMEKINDQSTQDSNHQRTGGMYNNVNMMHQYGAGAQDMLLMSNSGRRACVAFGRALSGQRAGPELRRLGHQRRNHVEHVARFLSWLYVRADRDPRARCAQKRPRIGGPRARKGTIPAP